MYLKSKFKFFWVWVFALTIPFVSAQTVNIGEVTVSENTIFSTVADFDNQTSGEFINNGDSYIYANWNNDGIVDFDTANLASTNGLTRFIGTSIQQITGNTTSFLNNVLFDNASNQFAFQLSGAVSVGTEANYTLGIVDNDNFGGTFTFQQNALDVNTSDVSHVDGPVEKVGDVDFIYPIGDAGFYRFAGISEPNTDTDQYTAKYFFEDTNINYPTANLSGDLVLVDDAEHWTIERNTGTSNVMITLSWRNVTTPSEILVAPLEDITIAYWNPTDQLWEHRPSVVNVEDQTVTTIAPMTDYGVFTLARVEQEMPCDFTIENTLITPNGDDINDVFTINYNETCVESVNVKIYNRWGVKVYEANNYGLNGNVFNGFSNGRLTMNENDRLPSGTYYYVLTITYNENNNASVVEKVDYLYINGDN